jgi:hypothetical protein
MMNDQADAFRSATNAHIQAVLGTRLSAARTSTDRPLRSRLNRVLTTRCREVRTCLDFCFRVKDRDPTDAFPDRVRPLGALLMTNLAE